MVRQCHDAGRHGWSGTCPKSCADIRVGSNQGHQGVDYTHPSTHMNIFNNNLNQFINSFAPSPEKKRQQRLQRMKRLRKQNAERQRQRQKEIQESRNEIKSLEKIDGFDSEKELDGELDLYAPDPVVASSRGTGLSAGCDGILADSLSEARAIQAYVNGEVGSMTADQFLDPAKDVVKKMAPGELNDTYEYIKQQKESAEELQKEMDELIEAMEACQKSDHEYACMMELHQKIDEDNKALLNDLIHENAPDSIKRAKKAWTILDNSLNRLSDLYQTKMTDGVACMASAQ